MMKAQGPDWIGLVWAGLPLVGCMILLAWQRLGQVRSMAISTTRLVVQMMLLAVVLRAIIAANQPALVLSIALAMLAVAAHTVGARQARGRWEIRVQAFGAMLVGAALVMAVSIRLSLGVQPWYDAQTVIPMLGMILGNSVTAVSLAAERFASDLRADRDLVELRLALGATPRQAATPALRSAVSAGLSPILNNMAIAGIVAIPGMTTGQLLAGADVGQAIRYQILLYLEIASTVAISVLILLAIRLSRHFTPAQQLRRETLEG
ncbi:ABC transporter permease [Tundrisphaera lichenicola]|uniref:ABC transporter permease n=1 Tax=Tundrisphaera lichenicola TaxID=2029860 RepID=UPI003EC05C56